MQVSEKSFELKTDDQLHLASTLFSSRQKSDHLIVIAPAANTPQYFYRNFASYTAEHSEFDVVTFDYRDVGDSKKQPIRTSNTSMSDWGEHDLNAAIEWASDKYDKIFLLGHSLAGQILPLAGERQRLAAAYFVSSAAPFHGYWKGWPKFKVLLFWYLIIPIATFLYGYLPGWCFGSKVSMPKAAALEWRKWGMNKNGIRLSDTGAVQKYDDLTIPIHFMGFSDDRTFAPYEAIQALMHKYSNSKTFFQYVKPRDLGLNKIGHFGFFRSKHQEKLWSMPIMYFTQFIKDFN